MSHVSCPNFFGSMKFPRLLEGSLKPPSQAEEPPGRMTSMDDQGRGDKVAQPAGRDATSSDVGRDVFTGRREDQQRQRRNENMRKKDAVKRKAAMQGRTIFKGPSSFPHMSNGASTGGWEDFFSRCPFSFASDAAASRQAPDPASGRGTLGTGMKVRPGGPGQRRKNHGKQPGSNEPKKPPCAPRSKKAGAGTSLMSRLEQQARSRRESMKRRAVKNDSADARDCFGDRNNFGLGGGVSRTNLTVQNVASFPRPFTQHPPKNLQGRGTSEGMYALDDSLVCGGVKDRQSSSCFPRQSARDACQGILDAIGKFRSYIRQRVHETVPGSATSAADAAAAASNAAGNASDDLLHLLLKSSVGISSVASPSPGDGEPIGPSHAADESLEINLDHILSNTPYREMLEDLFHSQSNVLQGGNPSMSLPVVARNYEESFMREPIWDHERACSMGESCECNYISARPGESFTGVEFTIPSEQCGAHGLEDHRQERRVHLCVLCHRKRVQGLFYDIVYGGMPYRGVIQCYGNICNVAGEYAREVMLVMPPVGPVENMPLPCVSHQRNRYSVYVKNGVRHIRQNRVSWEDFCQAPPSLAVP